MSVGTSGTITKPVANVPTRPPAVAHADSRPTTEPVSPRSRSCIRATVGVTALSTAAGGNSATSVTMKAAASPPPRSASPSPRMSGTVSIASTPPDASRTASSRRSSSRSAARPPTAAPAAIPARTVPMIVVVVSSVSPTYGASSRIPRISSTSTAPEETKTRPAATTGTLWGDQPGSTDDPWMPRRPLANGHGGEAPRGSVDSG